MKESKYPGKPEIEIVRVKDWSPRTLLLYMEHCRQILAKNQKKDKPA